MASSRTSSVLSHDLSNLDPAAKKALGREPAVFIDGEWVKSSRSTPVIDPSSGEVIAEIASAGAQEVDAAVTAARAALRSPEWMEMPPLSRERLLYRLVALIEESASALAQVETVDNGMPLWFSTGGVMGAADVYRYYAGWPSKLVGETKPVEGPPGSGKFFGMTSKEPVGVVAAIVPWNVPFVMAAWKLAPALAAGCSVVLKPAEQTSLTALMLADLARRAGFPKGVINVVTGTGEAAGDALVRHPGVDKISFTGSTRIGRRIGEIAGSSLKKHTLELGGKSPQLLFNSANLEEAAVGAATSIFLNSGQVCVAGSRLFVQSGIYDEAVERIDAHLKTLTVGAGLNDGVFMGPLVSEAQKMRVQSYLEKAANEGCSVFQGQPVEGGDGFYVTPTMITGVGDDSAITREEIFGPVLAVYRFDDEAEAVERANDSEYGLAANIWSQDISQVMRVTRALEVGKVLVNNPGFPYPGLPEGGFKGSGHGKDLGPEGIEACLKTKSMIMKL